jgi:phosphoribosylglycinamide formyltransferase-1
MHRNLTFAASNKHMAKIVVFGSGKGSNARRIIEYFKDSGKVQVAALVSDKPRRGFLDISYDYRINLEIVKGSELSDPKWIAHLKVMYRPDLIVLAGYLKLIPEAFIQAFPGKIINLHPALLPAYGGKGMYGSHVHQAVIEAGDAQSGITIHEVNEHYDEGKIIFQASCDVSLEDTPETLAQRIHQLEHEHLPTQIEKLLFP